MKRALFRRVVPGVAVLLLAVGCVTPSLQTPRPLSPGEVQLGAHASMLLAPRVNGQTFEDEMGEDVPFFMGTPSPWLTARVGVGGGFDVGGLLGPTAATVGVKYGLLDYDNPLQISLLGGGGLWGPILAEDVDGMPMFDIGALAGYEIADPIGIYGGFRRHQIFAEGTGSFGKNNFVVGVELFPQSVLSLPIELNYTLIPFYAGGMGLEEDVSIAAPAVNAGITLTF